ncbi:hypothetical protein SKAU_G00355490 [Synaphobranchus kaupii]|uniref:Uncharacterized protein n=1 Tax=Synaphobranchus kaupii TaxID=118154 RepID=A0A9Q1EH93_SYNKA|nr:hypothetical protein SKAU_G00355490 [Synaphobranchus kaupii]
MLSREGGAAGCIAVEAGGDGCIAVEAGGDGCIAVEAGGDGCIAVEAGGDGCIAVEAGGDGCIALEAGDVASSRRRAIDGATGWQRFWGNGMLRRGENGASVVCRGSRGSGVQGFRGGSAALRLGLPQVQRVGTDSLAGGVNENARNGVPLLLSVFKSQKPLFTVF